MDNAVLPLIQSFDIWMVIQQFVNIKAVLLAVFGTQGIKYFLPGPGPERTAEVLAGKWYTRLLPMAPVVIAFAVTYFLEADSKYTTEDAVRGILSGTFAAYLYRTTKVSIFGG